MQPGACGFLFNTQKPKSIRQGLKGVGKFTNGIRSDGAKARMSSEGGLDGWGMQEAVEVRIWSKWQLWN